MKWWYTLCSLVCIIHGTSSQDVEKVETSPVQQFFQTKCYKNAKQGDAYDQLVGLSYDFYKYAEYTATFLPLHLEHFCNNEIPILKLKLKDVNKQMLACLPNEENFLPAYIQQTFEEFLTFLCEREGANVKTFFSTHGKQCRNTLSYNNASAEVGACFSRVFKTVDDEGYLTKKTLCYDVGLMKGCFNGILKIYCPDFAAFTELNNQFFRHVNKPCSGCIFGINNLVTVICLLAVIFYQKRF